MPKHKVSVITTPASPKESLGLAPAILAKREQGKPENLWCAKKNLEFDIWCDTEKPRTILPREICKAAAAIKQEIPVTPLAKSKCCKQLGFDIYYKFEGFHQSGSFHERGAQYSLQMLSEDQQREGIYTASTGNWGKALAYRARRLKIPLTVVLPKSTCLDVVEKIQDYGANVILHGDNLAEAKKQAFILLQENESSIYINGYDHPHVIAAAGAIGAEILEQLPQTDAILVPVGGGGLIAGIASIVKRLKPEVLIYGLESDKCCSFFKAMVNQRPYQTYCGKTIADSLAVPTAGCNAFHTAQSLIDKLVLVDDDRIAQAILHLAEEEKIIAEGAAAIGLSAFVAKPHALPELREKNVVCVITGGNINKYILPLVLQRAMELNGRLEKIVVKLKDDDMGKKRKIFRVIANAGIHIRHCYIDKPWIYENDLETINLNLVCETQSLAHAFTLKRIMNRIFPNMCDFEEEPFSPIPVCICNRTGA